MARQRRAKKIRTAELFADAKEFVVRQASTLAVVIAFFVVASFLLRAFVGGSEYFVVRSVEVRGAPDAELLRLYQRKNIFSIRLPEIVRYLQSRFPDAKDISVIRSLPDKLTVSVTSRYPVALISNGSAAGYAIDDEGCVVVGLTDAARASLPVITGAVPRFIDRHGRRAASRNLSAALELLREVRAAKFLAKYRVVRIDAADTGNLSFILDDGIEVRTGCDDIRKKLASARGTLLDPRLARDRVRYIDVRFDDVVIGPK